MNNVKSDRVKFMKRGNRVPREFFMRDVLEVAPELIGSYLVVRSEREGIRRFVITETEAYRGMEDMACHASRGRTGRTDAMYMEGGRLYVYFVYGMYWMLNIVTAQEDNPQAVLIRGAGGINGPGRLTRAIGIDRSFYGEDLCVSERIWVENRELKPEIKCGPRIGIDYAGEYWRSKPWRYYTG
jgi:DNA-3-methyladenine glycosylase